MVGGSGEQKLAAACSGRAELEQNTVPFRLLDLVDPRSGQGLAELLRQCGQKNRVKRHDRVPPFKIKQIIKE